VDDAVEDSIGDRGFADHLMPARDGQLAGGPKNDDEDLCLMHGAAGWIGDRNRVARIIGLHDRPRLVSVAKARTGAVLKGPKLLAKPSIAVAVGVGRPVFLAQKHQGDALALQLRGNLGPVWLLKVLRWTAHPLEQRTKRTKSIPCLLTISESLDNFLTCPDTALAHALASRLIGRICPPVVTLDRLPQGIKLCLAVARLCYLFF